MKLPGLIHNHQLNIDQKSYHNPKSQFMGPVILFSVEIVGEDKRDRKGDKQKGGCIKTDNKEERTTVRQRTYRT